MNFTDRTPYRSYQRSHHKLGSPLFGLILAIVFLLPSMAFAQGPTLQPSDGYQVITQHEIGKNLLVSVDGAAPMTAYTLVLVDATGSEVVSTTLTTDSSGGAGPTFLWRRKDGIVGCDASAAPNPYFYRYVDDAAAEAALDGQTFSVELRSSAGGTISTLSLPLVTGTGPQIFFSDAAGCPRYLYSSGESGFLTLRRMPVGATPQDWELWLVDAPPTGPPTTDARPPYAITGQTFTLSTPATTHTVPILEWVGLPEECTLGQIQPVPDIEEEENPTSGSGSSGGSSSFPADHVTSAAAVPQTICETTGPLASDPRVCPPCE